MPILIATNFGQSGEGGWGEEEGGRGRGGGLLEGGRLIEGGAYSVFLYDM